MGNFERVEGIHMNFGTAVHAGIEAMLARDVEKRVALTKAITLARAMFLDFVDKNFQKYDERDRMTFGTEHTGFQEPDLMLIAIMAHSVTRILTDLTKIPEIMEATVMWNERKITQPITRTDGVQILFNGALDMAVVCKAKRGQKKYLWIIDFKTCSWGWSWQKLNDLHIQSQLFLYKHFICKELNLDPKTVHVAFTLLKKKPPFKKNEGVFMPAAEWIAVPSGPKAVERAVDSLQQDITAMAEAVQSGDMFADDEKCGDAADPSKGYLCQFYGDDQCPVTRQLGRRKPAPVAPSPSVSAE